MIRSLTIKTTFSRPLRHRLVLTIKNLIKIPTTQIVIPRERGGKNHFEYLITRKWRKFQYHNYLSISNPRVKSLKTLQLASCTVEVIVKFEQQVTKISAIQSNKNSGKWSTLYNEIFYFSEGKITIWLNFKNIV